MAAATARSKQASAGLLSIGQVLARLTPEFPGLSSSKLRYLEEQGLVTPQRTDSGYRKFSPSDVDRLRVALTLQRDRYLPLSVIRDYLDDVEAGRSTDESLVIPPSIAPAAKRYSRAELLGAAGASPQLLNDAISTGMITASDAYGEQTLSLLRALVDLDRHGIEPRHVRGLRQAAEREVALIESSLSALLRRTDAASRARADEVAPELLNRLDDVRRVFARQALARLMS